MSMLKKTKKNISPRDILKSAAGLSLFFMENSKELISKAYNYFPDIVKSNPGRQTRFQDEESFI
jgi:hypothetical protein